MSKIIYLSCDVESDGPIPGQNSMLSFAAVAFDEIGYEIDSFWTNLETVGQPDPDTMKWWETQPEAWAAIRKNPIPVEQAMRKFIDWVKMLPGKPVFVGYPATYDFMFIYWYVIRYVHQSPFGFQGLDIKTLAFSHLRKMKGLSFRETSKRRMPAEWLKNTAPHTHFPVDDARGQGQLFFRILQAIEKGDNK